ncbi:PorP/SprF family type IX secretion system membrane protein [Mucilaginibacter myungsuensis]|uniref:Type IX secretion system membrane protein PorP/SprF n=1 Tax=Mucilaginibacter myungsuensis TaxID=649104 RepID=A0A929KW88_9SPHI|nr:type IX secretion system membrane protein PorP/SprF [Mucilaginibacter myungsuensis]MBE9661615.1 type IX secretion system membrane protein PorP/SprF [Mucilaginibacter myungsuensis]MDN3597759.1 type IX secretion system membrane protein PorP/SprF [Mucilaginibacter myungsuensis]
MKLVRIYMLLMVLGVAYKGYAQQGIQFSQYAFTGLTVNPAYAGYKEDWSLNIVSRLQWTGIPGSPRTGAITYDGVIDAHKNVGLGFVVLGDQLGPQTTTTFLANYAYRLQLNSEDSKRLSLGVGVGAGQYIVDGSKFNPTDANDPNVNIGNASKISPTARLGAFYHSSKFYIGISGVNLLADAAFNKDRQNVVRQSRSFYLTAGYMMPLNENIDFKPNFLIKEDFKGPTNLDLSANILLGKTLWLGATYRTGVKSFSKTALTDNLSDYDAAAAIVQFYVNERFRIGYSFDYNMNKLATVQNGTHELGIGITFTKRREKVLSPRYF